MAASKRISSFFTRTSNESLNTDPTTTDDPKRVSLFRRLSVKVGLSGDSLNNSNSLLDQKPSTLKLDTNQATESSNSLGPLSGVLKKLTSSRLSKLVIVEGQAPSLASPLRSPASIQVAPWMEEDKPAVLSDMDVFQAKHNRPTSFGNIEMCMSKMFGLDAIGSIESLQELNLSASSQSYAQSDTKSFRDSNSTYQSHQLPFAFVKSYKKDRIYIACLCFNDKKAVLLNRRGMLPSICLYGDDDESGDIFNKFTSSSEQFLWMRQTALDFEPLVPDVTSLINPFSFVRENLVERHAEIDEPSAPTCKIRRNWYTATMQFAEQFKLKNLGVMHNEPLVMDSDKCIIVLHIVTVKDSIVTDGMKASGMSWGSVKNLNANVYSPGEPIWTGHELAYEQSQKCVKRGLYICHYIIQVTITGPMVLVQRMHPNLPPLVKLRPKAEMDELEREVLLSVIEDDSLMSCNAFTKSIIEAFDKFQLSIQTPLSISQLVSVDPTSLGLTANQIITVTIIPLGEKMCAYDASMFELIPLSLFEMIHFSVYDRDNYSNHFRKMRTLKAALKNLVKPAGKSESVSAWAVCNAEMKEGGRVFNEAKWTRRALNFGLKGNEGVVIEDDEETLLRKSITPF